MSRTSQVMAGLRNLLLWTTAGCFIAAMFTAAVGDWENTLFSIGAGCTGVFTYILSEPKA